MNIRKKMRNIQLIIIGFVAILIGPLTLGITTLVYHLPFLGSISESATIANQTAPLLPFCLGMLSIFALSYTITHAHDNLDRALPFLMFVGFTLVALQMCNSVYITQVRVGAFGLSPIVSNIVHCFGALLGFGAMIGWVLFCFTKSDKPIEKQTPEKRLRNKIYYTMGVLMVFSIILFLLNIFSAFKPEFPIIFVTEVIILTLGGIACIIKGGLILKDKEKKDKGGK